MAAPRELIIDVVGQSISGQGSGNRVIPTVPDTLTQYKQYEMNHVTFQIQASTYVLHTHSLTDRQMKLLSIKEL